MVIYYLMSILIYFFYLIILITFFVWKMTIILAFIKLSGKFGKFAYINKVNDKRYL